MDKNKAIQPTKRRL